MKFKQLSYWLQGGIIGLFIAVLFSGLIGLSVFIPGDWAFGYQFLWIPILAPIIIVLSILIGFLIGKVKKR